MSSKKDKIVAYLEIAKTLVEIAALLTAGLWAYAKFTETERPSLEFRGNITTKLDWSQIPTSKDCLGEFAVTITNEGLSSFNVKSVRLRIWLTDFPARTSEISRIDPDQFEKGAPAYDLKMVSKPLTGHYPPSVSDNFNYNFVVEKKDGKLKVAKARVDAIADTGELSSSRWDFVCGPKEFPWNGVVTGNRSRAIDS